MRAAPRVVTVTATPTSIVMLIRPRLRFTSTDESSFDAMTTWRADLELSYLHENGIESGPAVVAGRAEFLVIDVGREPVVELLNSLPQDTDRFAGLFEGSDVAPPVQEQFEDVPFNRILIVTVVEVSEPLRGNGLGAWVVADVIGRMASPIDTLVLLRPAPLGPQPSKAAELAGIRALSRYWQLYGLAPIKHVPDVLGAATAYSHLSRAREALRALENEVMAVPQSAITVEEPAQPRHTVVSDPEPVGLRLVRS